MSLLDLYSGQFEEATVDFFKIKMQSLWRTSNMSWFLKSKQQMFGYHALGM